MLNRLLVCVFLCVLLPGTSNSQTVVVTPEDPQGWGFLEEIPTGTGDFVNGPLMPPLGKGSIRMTVDATGRQIFGTTAFAGTRFDAITLLGYSTYRVQPDGVLAISLQFNVDYDLTDGDDTWQGRLVYEPYYTETVETGVWQTWDPLAGVWWASGAPGNTLCPISSPCSWSEVLMNWPDSGINATAELGGLLFKAGGPWDPFEGNVDAFVFGTMSSTMTFDFETPFIFDDNFESGDILSWSSSVP